MQTYVMIVWLATFGLCGAAKADVAAASERAKSGAFDATGEISCSQEVGQDFGICQVEVARAQTSALVVVTFANGFSRSLTFSDGNFLRGNPTMSGVGTDIEWRLADGVYTVRVDDQRFELPKTLVFGD